MPLDLRVKLFNRLFVSVNCEEIAGCRVDTARRQDILNHFFLEAGPQGVKGNQFI
jgi:hypothetical protein